MSDTAGRKLDHLRIADSDNIAFRHKTSGFECFDFIHCALPENHFDNIDTSVRFLDKNLSWPFMVSAMTGGHPDTAAVNEQLAELCTENGVALGLGSQRRLLEDGGAMESYRIVRRRMPDGVVLGNIGGVQLAGMKDLSDLQRLCDLVEADGMAVHLNPLQELLQPEGDRNFSDILRAIEKAVKVLSVPIIVKEVGCGISEEVALRLQAAGVQIVDVAGAGGTSWAAIESRRGGAKALAEAFWDWGLPTALCLESLADLGLTLIASGGIDSGVTAAKAVALGAHLTGAARPVLRALMAGGIEAGVSLLRQWKAEFQMTMLLTGVQDTVSLRNAPVLRKV